MKRILICVIALVCLASQVQAFTLHEGDGHTLSNGRTVTLTGFSEPDEIFVALEIGRETVWMIPGDKQRAGSVIIILVAADWQRKTAEFREVAK